VAHSEGAELSSVGNGLLCHRAASGRPQRSHAWSGAQRRGSAATLVTVV